MPYLSLGRYQYKRFRYDEYRLIYGRRIVAPRSRSSPWRRARPPPPPPHRLRCISPMPNYASRLLLLIASGHLSPRPPRQIQYILVSIHSATPFNDFDFPVGIYAILCRCDWRLLLLYTHNSLSRVALHAQFHAAFIRMTWPLSNYVLLITYRHYALYASCKVKATNARRFDGYS